jgi:hopene-associated glycosyltransferase HpnB
MDAAPGAVKEKIDDITALIPAKDEAETIGAVLRALAGQGEGLKIVLVDDRSEDGTAEEAMGASDGEIHIIKGRRLPPGWTGKLWALEQGRSIAKTDLTLLLDADIELRPGLLAELMRFKDERGYRFVSLMAVLRMETFWERLLMPAFIFFFKMLYPFHLSNSPSSRVAAAAGGCILLDSILLEQMGGFSALREELIDDCALAKRVKARGHRTWIGLTHSVLSLRSYDRLGEIWNMVARTAFTQLHYSISLLLLCTALLLVTFCLPVAVLIMGSAPARLLSLAALGIMFLCYLPTLRYYRMPSPWVFTLPFTASLYLCMTWSSALSYWQGRRSRWKGRTYDRK